MWIYQDGSYTDFGKPYASEDKSKWRGLKEKHHREISRRIELAMTTRGK
ncbi:hypothetical protein X997_5890 [Burkholderia pseudomallei A79C]|nr:hypothetical protein X997_5890 [Burkholderia pseudomallei A79C]